MSIERSTAVCRWGWEETPRLEKEGADSMGKPIRHGEKVQDHVGQTSHYHVIETALGQRDGYRDHLFRNRRHALEEAKTRAEWLAAVTSCRVERLFGPAGRYLVTTGRPHDPGRMVAVEECDDAECLEVDYGPMLES
jgi:hypothetical protein